jgi:hypothetical protein
LLGFAFPPSFITLTLSTTTTTITTTL